MSSRKWSNLSWFTLQKIQKRKFGLPDKVPLEISQDSTRISWPGGKPKNVLIVTKKATSDQTIHAVKDIAQFLRSQHDLNIILERNVQVLTNENNVSILSDDTAESDRTIDLVVGVGGDGTLLHISSLFPRNVPPVVPFSMGTLGYLMPFNVGSFKSVLNSILHARDYSITMRARISCDISYSTLPRQLKTTTTFQAMNEVVIQRGPSQNMLSIDMYSPHPIPSYITTTTTDGLILSTPTGSTAYSLSAGGPIIHPHVSALTLTPICPRSLSFRPLILPPSMNLILELSNESRAQEAEIVIDGQPCGWMKPISKQQTSAILESEDFSSVEKVSISLSQHGVPCISRAGVDGGDWVQDMNEMLGWNASFKRRSKLHEIQPITEREK